MNSQPGDLMFTFNRGNLISKAIAGSTHAKISHVQCIIDIGAGGMLQVVSADLDGLIDKWVASETYDWYGILTCSKLSLQNRDAICKWMWDHVGYGYDVWGLASFIINLDANNEYRLFCSEACFLGYQEAAGIWLLDGVDHAFVSPRDLWMSPLLQPLDGSRKEIR